VIHGSPRHSVGDVEVFIVERYLPGTTDRQLREATDLLSAAARDMAAGGTQIAFLGSTFVAAEEYCFCRFESGSAADVERACELAGVSYARIVAGRDLDPSATTSDPQNREGTET
jgi:uncharacterized protein DUF4242